MDQPELFNPPPQPWKPAAKNGCTRDPAAGPGTCWYWWEGCPNAARKGCHLLHLKGERERADAT